jgi:hypothetical protein
MPTYGQNVVTNPTGTQGTAGWAVSGAAAVAGGTDSGGYCFRLNSTGSMSQDVTFATQPPAVKVSAKFYSTVLNNRAPVNAYIKCTAIYADADPDEFYIPCTGGIFDFVPGVVGGQNVNWAYLESIFQIDDQKTLQKITVELICSNLGTYGYFDEIQVLPQLPDKPELLANNGEQIIDDYGINQDFIKSSQNMVVNSSFEQYTFDDAVAKYRPVGWTGGFVNNNITAYEGLHALELVPLQVRPTDSQTVQSGYYANDPMDCGMDPKAVFGDGNGRVSFYHRGEPVKLVVFVKKAGGSTPSLKLYETDVNAYTYEKSIPQNSGAWKRYDFGVDLSNVQQGEKVYIYFQHVGNATDSAYIDAVQFEKDFTGARASFYSSGPDMNLPEVTITNKLLHMSFEGSDYNLDAFDDPSFAERKTYTFQADTTWHIPRQGDVLMLMNFRLQTSQYGLSGPYSGEYTVYLYFNNDALDDFFMQKRFVPFDGDFYYGDFCFTSIIPNVEIGDYRPKAVVQLQQMSGKFFKQFLEVEVRLILL